MINITLQNLERRFKIASLPDHALMSCLTLTPCVPGDCLVKLSLNVPLGTIAVSRWYNSQTQREEVLLWNEAWPLVREGDVILEKLEPQVTYCIVKADIPRRESSCDQPLIRNAGVFTVEVRNEEGNKVTSLTFENPINVNPGETLVITGFTFSNGVEKVVNAQGDVGYKVPHPRDPLEDEFLNPALGEPHTSPFDKSWHDEKPLL